MHLFTAECQSISARGQNTTETWGQHSEVPSEERDLTLLGAASTIKQIVP